MPSIELKIKSASDQWSRPYVDMGIGHGQEPDGHGSSETPWPMGRGFWSTLISKLTFLKNRVVLSHIIIF